MRAAWLALRRERGNVTSFSPLRYLTFRRMIRDTHTHMHVYFISGTSFHALAQFFHWISKFVRDSMTVRRWSSLKVYIQGHSLSFVRSKNRGWEKLNERDGDEQHFWRGTFVYGLRLYIKKKKRKTGGRKRAEERSKKPGLSRAGDPWRETTSSEKNGWAANRATHGALSGYFAFYLTVPWRATRFNRLRS